MSKDNNKPAVECINEDGCRAIIVHADMPSIYEVHKSLRGLDTKTRVEFHIHTTSNDVGMAMQVVAFIQSHPDLQFSVSCYGTVGLFSLILTSAVNESTISKYGCAITSPPRTHVDGWYSADEHDSLGRHIREVETAALQLLAARMGVKVDECGAALFRVHTYTPEDLVKMKLIQKIDDGMRVRTVTSMCI